MPTPASPTIAGLLLAAGAGRRMGTTKALLRDSDGTSWLIRSVEVLRAGGCANVLVVLGAAADRAAPLLDGLPVGVVVAEEWADGMGASVRAGLAALGPSDAAAALVHLVDLPDVTPTVVARVLARAGSRPGPALARASYDGTPGHPVLLGRQHWAGVAEAAHGDQGARRYLAEHGATSVECGDLATGADRDEPTGDQRPRP